MTTKRRTILATIGLTAVLGMTAAFAGPQDATKSEVAKVGEAAPDFTLTDTDGKEHTLSDYKGKMVLLQWINPDCPVCVRVHSGDVETDMIKKLKELDKDLVHLDINSTSYMDGETTAAYLKKHKIDVTALIDQDGTVGKLYNAKTTPHMYLIDAEGVLRYAGAIDDDRNGRKGDEATNYVVNAITQLQADETVSPDTTKAYGCAVKYAD